jgi:hypothetical protein
MRAYWAKVAKRAAKEAGVAVFTSPERAVISVLLQLIAGAALFIAAGSAGADPTAKIIAAVSPFALYPIMFLWKMISVPALIHEAQRKEDSNERVAHVMYLSMIYNQEVKPPNEQLIHYGLAFPPEEWMNQKLEELGFQWRFRHIQGAQYVTEDVA